MFGGRGGETLSIDFLRPQIFDVLVIVAVIIGVILAGRRIRADFKSGPRFSEDDARQQDDHEHTES